MEEKHLVRIESLFTRLSDDFGRKVEGQSEALGKRIDARSAELGKRIDTLSGSVFPHNLDVVIEGVRMLSGKRDRFEAGMDGFEVKLDKLSVGLTAHLMDPGVHRQMYRVREEG